MTDFALPYFGQLKLNSLEEYYSAETEFNGVTVSLDLNFENKTVALAAMKSVKKIVDDIPRLDEQKNIYR